MPSKTKSGGKKKWQIVAAEAQAHRDSSIQEALAIEKNHLFGPLLPAQVTALDPRTIVQKLRHGELDARHVVSAFLVQAAAAQQATNCLTELLGTRALNRAAALDAYLVSDNAEKSGPLHGVPISVKSHIGIKDGHMPAGYITWWNNISPRDALVVQILERAGAIVHARTTEPQSMMQLECASNLYGVTTNPHHKHLSSGGSSGGEAALVALGGSSIGVGSDVGGSIRVPAAACGIFGLKPTAFRVPTTGWSSTPPGADPIPTVIGPMSRSIDGIEMFMSAVLAAEPWTVEPALVPLSWRSPTQLGLDNRPLRIGIALHDGTVMPHPPITRTLTELADKMKAIPGVEVIDFPLYKLDEAWAIVSSLYFTDGGKADVAAMNASGEPVLPLVEWILHENPGTKELTREELEYWLEEREEYRLEYAEQWNKTGQWDEELGKWADSVDVLIGPVAPGVATRHGTAKYWAYSAVWNLLDYPALAFPAGRACKEKDAPRKERSRKFMSEHDRTNWDLYDPDLFDGMSVGLQMVGRRFDDEKIVAVYRYLQAHGCVDEIPR
ncbi:amidase signature domain-containing protein [Podospora didyma]|uniref:amidase n=1 Tax=Podospora didyma TaxID=330526 RepID=A0AAE0P7V0_9PEZI|nr:amidase signature domain-containing protein [Podospora didyma]